METNSIHFLLLEFPLLAAQASGDAALALAQTISGFDQLALADNKGRLCVPLEQAGFAQDGLAELWKEIRKRPGSIMSIDGTAVDWEAFTSILRIQECAKLHTNDAHCVSKYGWDWGCVFLSHIVPQENSGKTLDRVGLTGRLQAEASSLRLLTCPYFSLEKLEAKLDSFCRNSAAVMAKFQGEAPVRSLPSRTAADIAKPAQPVVQPARYSDVGGLDDVILALREAMELPLKHPEVMRRLGITPPRGCILFGPPGCGKTLLARALASESGVAFMPVSGPELVTKWHGESEEKLRELFKRAQEAQPAIIFFDEIDAIAQARSSSESLRFDAKFTAQLLTLMDGIYDLGNVFVLAATNRLDLLDSALLRPGRFDSVITIPKPDRAGCENILRIHAGKLPLENGIDLSELAGELVGFTGADIAYLVRGAAHAALRRQFHLPELLNQQGPLSSGILESLLVTKKDFAMALAQLRKRAEVIRHEEDTCGCPAAD